MPILITFPAPVQTTAALPVLTVYAIIERVSYTRRGLAPKTLQFVVAYYANDAASTSGADSIDLKGVPTEFSQVTNPDQANTLPIFTFLEQLLTTQLTAQLPAGTTFANVA